MNKLEILKVIEDNGFKAYVVGGYPRDLYLNRKSNDMDICTNAKPKDLVNIFKDAVIANNSYGSVTVLYKNKKYEITTFRKETSYFNYRFPKIEYIDNLLDDLKRRDFTINTLCIDSEGNLIDLLNVKNDLDSKVLKMVGDAKIKLKEDALRILRAVRFATVLNFQIDEELSNYIEKYAYLTKKLSYERKKSELDKILSSNNIIYGLELLKRYELDKYLEIDLSNLVITDLLGIWSQIDKGKYKFNSTEKDIINNIHELKGKDIFDPYTLYKYGLYVTSIRANIDGISKEMVTSSYNALPMKSRADI